MTPPKLGTVWTATAKIQAINLTTAKWDTLATCMDTPNAIQAEVKKLIAAGHDRWTLWVSGDATGRRLVSEL